LRTVATLTASLAAVMGGAKGGFNTKLVPTNSIVDNTSTFLQKSFRI
jgi:hypothetical protein